MDLGQWGLPQEVIHRQLGGAFYFCDIPYLIFEPCMPLGVDCQVCHVPYVFAVLRPPVDLLWWSSGLARLLCLLL